MKLIVGLGNPGAFYVGTRHNLGRSLIEHIGNNLKVKFSLKKSLRAFVSSVTWQGKQVVLAFPETFMNLSGTAVANCVGHFKIDFQKDLLVVLDDAALPIGKLDK